MLNAIPTLTPDGTFTERSRLTIAAPTVGPQAAAGPVTPVLTRIIDELGRPLAAVFVPDGELL